MDVAIGTIGGGITVLLGNGDGTFQPPQTYFGGGGFPVLVGDFNQDGKLDLIAAPSVPGVAEFLGNGDGTFQPAQIYPSGSGSPSAAGDLNGDNKLDVVLLNFARATITTMLNTGELRFSPSSPLRFPAQLINTTSSSEAVELRNTGGVALSIASIKALGPFATTNTCGGAIEAGASCTISATFTPSRSGQQSGGITILDAASSKPQFIELTGLGTVVKVSPSGLTFGSQKVGTRSTVQVVTVVNEGNTALQYSAPTIVGRDPKDFSETNNCTGHSIPPGGSCEVSVTFAPTKTGARSGELYINPQGTAAPQPVGLSGTGT